MDRNQALGFACRTRKNLDFIRSARKNGEDVHEVTQAVLSVLGLLIFPWEEAVQSGDAKKSKNFLKEFSIDCLKKNNWPQFEVCPGEPGTLHDLIFHLRNAVAHKRIKFSSDSRNLEDVTLTFKDYPKNRGSNPNWIAKINGEGLIQFCLKLIELIKEKCG